MTTAKQIVDGAAEEIGVKTAEIQLEAADAQIIFDRMNDLLVEWADIGLTPEFQEVFSLDSTVQVNRNAVAAIKLHLAIRCASSFQKVVTQALVLTAADAIARLETSTAHIGPVAYPDTLPLGSGNDCGRFYDDERFFPSNKKENF